MPACTPITDRFQTLSDSRSAIHITYSLPEVLFIVYASVLSGYNEWESMANFGSYVSACQTASTKHNFNA